MKDRRFLEEKKDAGKQNKKLVPLSRKSAVRLGAACLRGVLNIVALALLNAAAQLQLLEWEWVLLVLLQIVALAFLTMSGENMHLAWRIVGGLIGSFQFFASKIFIVPSRQFAWWTVLLLFAAGAVFAETFTTAILALLARKSAGQSPATRVRKKVWIDFLTFWGLGMATIAIYWVAFNPAILYWDSYYQIAQAMHTTAYDNWHPLYTTLAIEAILCLTHSISVVVAVSAAYWVAVVAGAANLFYGWFGHKKMVAVCMLLFLLSPGQGLSAVTILKDVPYMASTLWMTLIVLRLLTLKLEQKVSWGICVEAVLAAASAYLVRTNGMVVMTGFFVALLVVLYRKNLVKFAAIAAGSLAYIVLFQTVVLGSLGGYIEVPKGAKYLALLNDLEVVYAQGCTVSDEVEEMLLMAYPDQEGWKAMRAENMDYVCNTFNLDYMAEYPVGKFVCGYMNTFFRHPQKLTDAVLIRTLVGWDVLGKTGNATIIGITEYVSAEKAQNILPFYQATSLRDTGERHENVLTNILQGVTDWSLEAPQVNLIWRSGVSAMLLACEIMDVLRRRRFRLLLAFLPVLFHILGLLLCVGWSNYRYFWPITVLALALIPLCCRAEEAEKESVAV